MKIATLVMVFISSFMFGSALVSLLLSDSAQEGITALIAMGLAALAWYIASRLHLEMA